MQENKYNDEFFKQFEERTEISRTSRRVEQQKISRYRRKKGFNAARFLTVITSLLLIVTIGVLAAVFLPKLNKKSGEGDESESLAQNAEVQVEEPIIVNYYPETTQATRAFKTSLTSEYAILVDVKNNTVIADKNGDAVMYPASMTKVLTLLVAVEKIEDLNDTFTMTSEIVNSCYKDEASVAGFVAEEKVKIIDLLYGVVLPSGADATMGLAEYLCGSEEAFVELMNKKIEELHLDTAHFCNTSGLHNDGHYCTAKDMAVIMAQAMQNDLCRKILSTYQYTTNPTPEHPTGILLTSTMFSRMVGDESKVALIIAGKTGFTDEAGNCLVSYATTPEGGEYILVTAKSNRNWNAIFDHIHVYGKDLPECEKPAENTPSSLPS